MRKCSILFCIFALSACEKAPTAPPTEAPAEAPAPVKAPEVVETPAPTEAPAPMEGSPNEVKKPAWEDKRLHEVIGAAARVEFTVRALAAKEQREGELKDKEKIKALLDAIDLGQELKPAATPRCIYGITATFFDQRDQPLGAVAVCASEGPLLDGAQAVFIEAGGDTAATSIRLYRASVVGEMAQKIATTVSPLGGAAAPAEAPPAAP